MGIPEIIISVLAFIFTFCGFFGWFFWLRSKHKERMMMIEKGLPLIEMSRESKPSTSILQKIGIIAIGFGLGLAIISILLIVGLEHVVDSGPTPVAILILCTGIALMVGSRRKNNNN